ncbi:MAG: dihydroorotate dehydrogenase electron transfer subunit [Candidatus Omnitrophica bacterium]|nr:dihydroorotate dehydrogenase electron transfer subunit [Candidatus Omnitrophota bacterium]
MIQQVIAKIVKNKKISPSVNYLELEIPEIFKTLLPGQFLHIRILAAVDPLLRRPFSVNNVIKKQGSGCYRVAIVYKIVGKGTQILSEKCRGDELDVLGPLGNGFDINSCLVKKRSVLLIGGGMGIAPLVYLAEKLKKQIKQGKIKAFIGTNTKKEIICVNEFKKAGCKVMISTDDGSAGFKGYVTELFEKYLSDPQSLNHIPYLYACGPFPMLKKLSELARKLKIEGQVSVDEMMGCGIGACLGCVIKTKNSQNSVIGYKRICKDGPVFDINELDWGE